MNLFLFISQDFSFFKPFFSYIAHVHTKSATYSLGWSAPSGPWSGAVTGLWFAGGRGDWLGGGRTWSAHPPPPPAPDETPRCSGSATLDSDRASDGHLPSPPPASAFLWHTLGHRDLNKTKIKIFYWYITFFYFFKPLNLWIIFPFFIPLTNYLRKPQIVQSRLRKYYVIIMNIPWNFKKSFCYRNIKVSSSFITYSELTAF